MQHELPIRLGAFAAVFVSMALLERLLPRRELSEPRNRRWFCNVGLVAIDTIVVRAVVPLAAVGVALVAEERGWGALNYFAAPNYLGIPLAIVVLDLVIYAQHFAFHHVPLLWRFHRVHHTDLDVDVTTGLRFHPVEILLSMGIKMAAVLAIGAPAGAVVLLEVVLNATSMFNHSNLRIAQPVDKFLRTVIVTPDMHRVHHSIVHHETNSNFGFNLPWWDRVFGTYQAQPRDGHTAMTIGLDDFRNPGEQRLSSLLVNPLKRVDQPSAEAKEGRPTV